MRIKTFWVERVRTVTEPCEGGTHSYGIFRRVGSDEEWAGHELPPGAMVVVGRQGDAEPSYPYRYGSDGLSVAIVLPGRGWWYTESRASNCTKPNDDQHRCWCRHGTFGETVHVDKNGDTCQAGGGSIIWGSFHGFLHNGELYDV